MFCTNCAERPGLGLSQLALAGFLATAALFASGSGVYAQDQDSILKKGFKLFGFATDVAPPADFVKQTRPPVDPNYIPVFQPPPEPARPVLKGDELKAIRGDLDATGKLHDTIRQAFPPSAKAMAEQKAAQNKPGSSAASAQH
jgi:hypothetical protein